MAAPRALVPTTMALLLVAVVFLSHVPASAPATLPTVVPLASATITSSSRAASSSCKPVGPSGDDKEKKEDKPKGKSGEDKEKEEEKKKQRKKEDEAIEEYGRENHIVSPTDGKGSYKGIAREFVDDHNKARARYGVPPMKWDNKLARHARRWADAMRMDCQLTHSVTDYGESIFLSHDDWNATATDAVNWWSTEEPIYDKLTGNCTGGHEFRDCGHFALMVAEKNRKVGCARAECYKGGVFILCNYYVN